MIEFSDGLLSWFESLLFERYGHKFVLSHKSCVLVIRYPGCKGEIIFDQLQSVFHQSDSSFSCGHWDAVAEGYSPPIYSRIPAPIEGVLSNPLVETNDRDSVVHYDILGLAYWMLSRLEEIDCFELDAHRRFPATSSHAYRHGYLERPIVDEWFNILGQIMQKTWPEIKMKKHEFNIQVSHDVDVPSLYAFQPWSKVIRMMAGHLIKRRDVKACLQAPYIKLTSVKSLSICDPFNTFEWIMDVSEANHIRSAFYFICGRTNPIKDADYDIEYPIIRGLIKHMHERGHEIGLHPSYNTYLQPSLIKQEYQRLKKVCKEEGVEQAIWGGRMHYLRWQQPVTMNAWADAGLDYDATLGYADRPGFRCGTCFEYPAFDPVLQSQQGIRIRPLIVMESTLFGGGYMNLDNINIEELILQLMSRCRKVGGVFSLLWHNSSFTSPEQKQLYLRVLGS